MAKWALGYELIPNNDDSIEHNMGRILFLKTFDLDLKDVADAIEDEQTDKPSLMNKIDSTYVSKKLWDKQILQTPGATEAVEKAANNDEY
ncbi:unnamed protein product [Adineta steineri]|uniref:Uncharacterized protein n=1 Tax=Adineta steineri TaxID=433720 RepID=A0A819JMW5_9BILA|nr:unnamed protein product [Adineta steineri]